MLIDIKDNIYEIVVHFWSEADEKTILVLANSVDVAIGELKKTLNEYVQGSKFHDYDIVSVKKIKYYDFIIKE